MLTETFISIGLGGLLEMSIFRLAQFDPIDFFNQSVGARPINPQLLFWKLSPKLPDNCIITSDSGSAANWFARDLKVRPPMMASLSGGLATMLPGVPYVIAAKFVDRPAIALVPHITFEQARKYLTSILRGDPDLPRQFVQSLKGVAQSWLPGTGRG